MQPGVHEAHVDAREGGESVPLVPFGEATKNSVLSSLLACAASQHSEEGCRQSAELAVLDDLVLAVLAELIPRPQHHQRHL
jgi:hypothetical protein